MPVTHASSTPIPTTTPRATSTPQQAPAVQDFAGYAPHVAGYRTLMCALFLAGVATFTQLYAPQALLPQLTLGLGVSEGDSGLVVSMGTIGLALGVFPWAWIADRFGRVPVMCCATVIGSVSAIIGSFSPTLHILLGARLLTGFAVGAVPVLALAFLNSQMQRGSAARAAGVFVAGNSVGGLLGRLVAGSAAAQWGWQSGLLTAALFGALAGIGFVLLVPAERAVRSDSPAPIPAATPPTHTPSQREVWGRRNPFVANLTNPTQLKIFAMGFVLMGVFVPMYNFLGFRLQHVFAVPEKFTSMLFFGVLSGVFTALWAATLVERMGRGRVVAVSAVIMLAGLGCTLLPLLWAQVAGLLFVSVGFFGGHSVASGWASIGSPDTRTQAGALYTLAYYGGGSLLGWLGGHVYGEFGWGALVGLLACGALGCMVVALSVRGQARK